MRARDIADRAACKGVDPEAFFYDDDSYIPPEIKKLCEGCPIRDQCLQMAIDDGLTHGIYGGKTPAQRTEGARRASCVYGHPWPEFLYVTASGAVKCKQCRNIATGKNRPGVVNGKRIECANGHPWIRENWVIRRDRGKRCRLCLEDADTNRINSLSARGECANGHEWPKHLVIGSTGRHKCGECKRLSQKKYRESKGKPDRSKCGRGHPLEGDNLAVDRAGRRQCRQCKRNAYAVRMQRAEAM